MIFYNIPFKPFMVFNNFFLPITMIVLNSVLINISAEAQQFAKEVNLEASQDQLDLSDLQNNLCTHSMAGKTSESFENSYRQFVASNRIAKKSSSLIKIPVVFHTYTDDGNRMIYDSTELREFVHLLNDEFRHRSPNQIYTNPYYGIDTEIEFHIALTDPEGNYTSGVLSHGSCVKVNGENVNGVLSNKNWDTSRYINIHYYPELPGAYGFGSPGSIIVKYLDRGLISHELGHALSLGHTYGNNDCSNTDCTAQGDRICDTPPKYAAGFTIGSGNSPDPCVNPGNSCTSDVDDTSVNNPYRAISLGGLGDQADMLENYMDITGSCWDSWTLGQKDRMHFFIQDQKPEYLNSASLIAHRNRNALDLAVESIDVIRQDVHDPDLSLDVRIRNLGSSVVNSFTIEVQLNGSTVYSQTTTVSITPNGSALIPMTDLATLHDETNSLNVIIHSPSGQTDQGVYDNQLCMPLFYVVGKSERRIAYGCTPINPNTINGAETIIDIQDNAFVTPPANAQNIKLEITTVGDFAAPAKAFSVYDEQDNYLGGTKTGLRCSYGNSTEILMSTNQYVQSIADGTLSLRFTPAFNNINFEQCGGTFTSRICIALIIPQEVTIECKEVVNISMGGEERISISPEDLINPNIELTGSEQFLLSQDVVSCYDFPAMGNPNVHCVQLQDGDYLEVNGFNDHDSEGIEADSTFTIEFTISAPAGISEGEIFLSRSTPGQNGTIVMQRGNGPLLGNQTIVLFNGNLLLRAWWRPSGGIPTPVSLVYDGRKEVSSDRLKMYIYGVPVPTVVYYGTVPEAMAINDDPFLFASRESFISTPTSTSTIYIDEVKLWKRARTAEELLEEYKKCYQITDPSLTVYLPLNDGFPDNFTTNLGTSKIYGRIHSDSGNNQSSYIYSSLRLDCDQYYAKKIEVTLVDGNQMSTCESEIRLTDPQGICCSIDTNLVNQMDSSKLAFKARDLIVSDISVIDELYLMAPEIILDEDFQVDLGNELCALGTTCMTQCQDQIQNGNETGVDCGGGDCQPCAADYVDLAISSFSFNAGATTISIQNVGTAVYDLPAEDVVIDFWWTDNPNSLLGASYHFIAINDHVQSFQPGQTITLNFDGLAINPSYDYLYAYIDKRLALNERYLENNLARTNFGL